MLLLVSLVALTVSLALAAAVGHPSLLALSLNAFAAATNAFCFYLIRRSR